jgi:hypothetical protein
VDLPDEAKSKDIWLLKMVGRDRFELSTNWLKVRYMLHS